MVLVGAQKRRFAAIGSRKTRPLVQVALVEPLRPLFKCVHNLFDLPLVGLVQNCGENLLDPRRHLPADALLLFRGTVTPGDRRVVAVPTGCVPQGVPYTVRALLVQRLPEAGLGLRTLAQTIPVLELAFQAPVSSCSVKSLREPTLYCKVREIMPSMLATRYSKTRSVRRTRVERYRQVRAFAENVQNGDRY